MVGRNEEPIRPRNGHTFMVAIVCRISGCTKQKEVSLDDQEDNGREKVAEVYPGPVHFDVISTKGKGENLERPELERIQAAYRSRKYDLIVYDDLSRLIRGGEAAKLLGIGIDKGTRSICINDGIDTNDETWEEDALNACSENVAHCQRTSKRIKQKTMNRFKKAGTTGDRSIAGYTVPEEAESYDDWQKNNAWEKVIHDGAALLRKTHNGSDVAEHFRKEGFPVGPFARNKVWNGTMVLRYYRNTLLKGMPQRGKMATVKEHGSGKRVSRKNPKGPTYYHAPHLAFFQEREFDELVELLKDANKHYRRKKVTGVDPRTGVPRSRTRPLGQHATCWCCGRHYVWGANGITGNLMCSGAREWKCWNSIGINGELATEQLVREILQRVTSLHGVEQQFQEIVRAVREEGQHGTRDEWTKLEADEAVHQEEKGNLLKAIRKCGPNEFLEADLALITECGRVLAARRLRLEQLSRCDLQLPDSAASIRSLVSAQLHHHAINSFGMAELLRQLVPQFHVYLVRLCDGGHLLPRAKVTLNLLESFPDAAMVPGLSELLQQEFTLDLFKPPQREQIREQAVVLSATMKQREIAAALPETPTQTAVWKALALERLMREQGLSSPYVLIEEPPADYGKLRRHKNCQYRLEIREGYQRPTL